MWVTQPERPKCVKDKVKRPKALQLDVGSSSLMIFYLVAVDDDLDASNADDGDDGVVADDVNVDCWLAESSDWLAMQVVCSQPGGIGGMDRQCCHASTTVATVQYQNS